MKDAPALVPNPLRVEIEQRLTQAGRRLAASSEALEQARQELYAAMRAAHAEGLSFSTDDAPVFATSAGTPMNYRNVERRGLDKAAESLAAGPKLRFHDLRHCFASILINAGADVVFVSCQLGHANPAITLRIYAHEFGMLEHAEKMRQALEERFAGKLERDWKDEDGKRGEVTGNSTPAESGKVAVLHSR